MIELLNGLQEEVMETEKRHKNGEISTMDAIRISEKIAERYHNLIFDYSYYHSRDNELFFAVHQCNACIWDFQRRMWLARYEEWKVILNGGE